MEPSGEARASALRRLLSVVRTRRIFDTMRPPLRFRCLALACIAAACTGTEPSASASLRFSGAADVEDTIGAVLAQPLVVEVRGATGAPAPAGTVVWFTPVTPVQARGPEVLPAPPAPRTLGGTDSATTDASGRATMPVVLGNTAGHGRLAVSVPALGLKDTARITVNPGNAYQTVVAPLDTVLYVGRSFPLRATVISDRLGNPRAERVLLWRSSGPGLTVTPAGDVTATATGRYRITAVGLDTTVGGAVSVVPQGRLAVWFLSPGSMTVAAADLDGSNRTTLATAIGDPHPTWIPGTTAMVYTTTVGPYQTIYTVGPDRAARAFFPTPPPNVTDALEPAPSADGRWVYFSAHDTRCSATAYCIARARSDGSAPELLMSSPSRSPAPSPDGSRVAYVGGDGRIRVFDVATQATSAWSVPGSAPVWSPDGTQIGYLADESIALVAPDGTGGRTLDFGASTFAWLAWSPDGRWLVVQPRSEPPALIDVAAGVRIPLANFLSYSYMTPTSMR